MPDRRHRQIMVVDMLEGFTRLGPLSSPRVDALVTKQVEFLKRAHIGDWVVFLNDAHEPDDVEFRRFPPHCIYGTQESEIRRELIEAISKGVRITVIPKTTFSGFHNTELGHLIESSPHKEWTVFGCVTDCCVEANVAELVYRGCQVTVVRDLIDTWHAPPEHDADAINREWFDHRFPRIWGAKVIDAATAD